MSEERRNPETVISGSFHDKERVDQIVARFEHAGVSVLAPKRGTAVDPEKKFVVLVTDDPNKGPAEKEKDYLREIRRSDFHYIADFKGRIGQSAATEMAYARLKDVPIVVAEEIKEFSDDIPEAVRPLLAEAVREILPEDQITAENIEIVQKRLENVHLPELEPGQAVVLKGLIDRLLSQLRHSLE